MRYLKTLNATSDFLGVSLDGMIPYYTFNSYIFFKESRSILCWNITGSKKASFYCQHKYNDKVVFTNFLGSVKL